MKKHVVVLLLLGLALSPARANLLTNGSFESGHSISGGAITSLDPTNPAELPGWTLQGAASQSPANYWWYMSSGTWGMAQDGNRFLNPTYADESLSQSFPVIAGMRYTVSFYEALRADVSGLNETLTASVSLAAGGAAGTLSLPASNTNGITSAANWKLFTFDFVPDTTTSATLRFTANQFGHVVLDNVGVTAVPEPSTVTFSLLALGLLSARLRSR